MWRGGTHRGPGGGETSRHVCGGWKSRRNTGVGWSAAGVVPNFAELPDGGLAGTTILFKNLPADTDRADATGRTSQVALR
jgi:hypothetical protein